MMDHNLLRGTTATVNRFSEYIQFIDTNLNHLFYMIVCHSLYAYERLLNLKRGHPVATIAAKNLVLALQKSVRV